MWRRVSLLHAYSQAKAYHALDACGAVTIARLAPPPPPFWCDQLVKDGIFDAGLTHWNYWEDPPGTTYEHVGTYIRVYSPEGRVGLSCLYQTIDLPVATYTLRFFASVCLFWEKGREYWGFQPMPITVKLWDGDFDIEKTPLWEKTWWDTSYEDGTFHWIGISATFTVTNTVPKVTLGFVFDDAYSDEWFVWYTDDVSLHVREF